MLMFSNLVASKMLNDAGKRSLRPHSHRVILHLSKFEAGNTTGICKIEFKYWIRVQIRFEFQIMHSNLFVIRKFVIESMRLALFELESEKVESIQVLNFKFSIQT